MTTDMPKVRVYATIREDLVKWLDQEVESRIYHNRSHAIEVLVLKEMRSARADDTVRDLDQDDMLGGKAWKETKKHEPK